MVMLLDKLMEIMMGLWKEREQVMKIESELEAGKE
jgi:hypothetical protein